MTKTLWDSYLETAREKYEDIDSAERYKMDLAKALASAREALLREERDWPTLVKEAITHRQNNIIDWRRNRPKLSEWIDGNVAEAREALSKMWSEDDRTPGDRVRAFDGILPKSVFLRTAVGTRLNAASYLMMGIDPHRYPPYRKTPFRSALQMLGYPQSSADDAGGEYEYFLDFLDRVLKEARRRGMDRPSTRLEAQSVVWHLKQSPGIGGTSQGPTGHTPERESPSPPPVRHALNTILYGPPGTGKTWHTVTRAVAVVENREVAEVEQEDRAAVKCRFDEYRGAGRIEMVTFHQNTTYEDFVEGIRPVLDVEEVRYEMSRGVFRRITERAALDLNRCYVLVIDEINRGNIARIFGELITLIEDSKRIGQDDEARVMLPGSKTEFGVPGNLHVLGTMNTADRSIALLDTALRRRFVFVEMMPDPFHPGVGRDVDGVDCRKVLDAMNRRIAVLLDREHQIGHTYFLDVDSLAALARTFQTRIMPLLQEYFYDDWEKIRAVLNDNGFVLRSNPPEELVRLDLVDANRAVYDLPPGTKDRWTDPTAYRAIYERTDDGSAAQGD